MDGKWVRRGSPASQLAPLHAPPPAAAAAAAGTTATASSASAGLPKPYVLQLAEQVLAAVVKAAEALPPVPVHRCSCSPKP